MKNILFISLFCITAIQLNAQNFQDYFINKTLRIDYIFSGDANNQKIYVDELSQLPTWAGKRNRLTDIPLQGNGKIEMKDLKSGKSIFKNSFSTLFQEWLTTEEAQNTPKGFENTYLLPYPKQPVEISISFRNNKGNYDTLLKHIVKPDDILIHTRGESNITPHKYLLKNGTTEDCIDIAILGEGYTIQEIETFYKDAQTAYESIFAYEPFKTLKDRFNVVAVASPSIDSGVSIPGKKEWRNTAFSSHFNTFYSDRYLTTNQVKNVHNSLAGIPYEHIIILANTEQYGGGGIYNAFTLTTAHHPSFKPVVVHEFGHSFGGLADEYYYEGDTFSDTYPFTIEPWEANITTMVDLDSKWKDMLPSNIPIPTPENKSKQYPVGLYEGGGYSAKGIYRPAVDCRMKTNTATEFCPVCQRALERIINFYTNK